MASAAIVYSTTPLGYSYKSEGYVGYASTDPYQTSYYAYADTYSDTRVIKCGAGAKLDSGAMLGYDSGRYWAKAQGTTNDAYSSKMYSYTQGFDSSGYTQRNYRK